MYLKFPKPAQRGWSHCSVVHGDMQFVEECVVRWKKATRAWRFDWPEHVKLWMKRIVTLEPWGRLSLVVLHTTRPSIHRLASATIFTSTEFLCGHLCLLIFNLNRPQVSSLGTISLCSTRGLPLIIWDLVARVSSCYPDVTSMCVLQPVRTKLANKPSGPFQLVIAKQIWKIQKWIDVGSLKIGTEVSW